MSVTCFVGKYDCSPLFSNILEALTPLYVGLILSVCVWTVATVGESDANPGWMCSPLPLRLWCMAAMAPALTTEAATRARDTLTTPAPTNNIGDGSVVNNGRVYDSSTVLTGKSRIVTLPKQFIQRTVLDPRLAHVPLVSRSLVVNNKNIVNLGTISDLSKICHGQKTEVRVSSTVDKALRTTTTMTHASTMSTNTSTVVGSKLLSLNVTAAGLCGGTVTGQPCQTNTKLSTQPVSTNHRMELSNGIDVVTQSHTRVVASTSVTHCSVKPTVFDTGRRQRDLEVRVDRMLHRLRRLQSRQSISHTKQQLAGFMADQQKNLDAFTKLSRSAGGSSTIDLKAELLQSKDVKNLSTAALVNLVHKLQSSQPLTLRQHLAGANNTAEVAVTEPAMKLDGDLSTQLEQTAGQLHTNLRHLEGNWDSDATESSSGGESCDEMDYGYPWDEKLPKPAMNRRAEWRWTRDRSAVASRWTWLQAQVSDLEYRIRQQNDIYRQIRMNKGAVTLGDPPVVQDLTTRTRMLRPVLKKCSDGEVGVSATRSEASPCNISTLLCNVDKQSIHLTQQLGNVFSPQGSPMVTANCHQVAAASRLKSQNGFVEHGLNNCTATTADVPGSVNINKTAQQPTDSGVSLVTFDPPSPANDITCQAVRCRPVQSYRKRKLLRTAGLHLVSRKAARLSMVRCHCYPPVVPCAICGGRYNNTQTAEPGVMTLAERVALLDASYHAILSFPGEIPLSLHFESLLRTGDWQTKQQPPKSSQKPTRLNNVNRKRQKLVKEHIRKYNRRLPKSTSAIVLSSAKIRNKYEQKQLVRGHSSLPSTPTNSSPAKKRLCRTDIKMKKRKAPYALRKRGRFGLACSRLLHPSLSPHLGGCGDANSPLGFGYTKAELREAQRKSRRGDNAFDINNIVIPYSIALATRMEKLQYKEILTPKWREISSFESPLKSDCDTSFDQETTEPFHDETGKSSTDPDVARIACDVSKTPDDASRMPSDVSKTPVIKKTTVDAAKTTVDVVLKMPNDVSTPPCAMLSVPADQASVVTHSPAALFLDTELAKTATSSIVTVTHPTDVVVVREAVPNEKVPVQNTPEVITEPSRVQQSDVDKQPPDVDATDEKARRGKDAVTPPLGATGDSGVLDIDEDASDGVCTAGDTATSLNVAAPSVASPLFVTVKEGVGSEDNPSEDEQVEDLSDEIFSARHLRCEIREKKYFVSCLKHQKSRRSARTESTSTVASDPASPDGMMHFDGGLVSPQLLVPPTTPPSEDPEVRQRSGSTSSAKHEDVPVKRTASVSKGLGFGRGRTSSIHLDLGMEEERYVAPWILRDFPLDDDEYEFLFCERPPTPVATYLRVPASSSIVRATEDDSTVSLDGSRPTSPLSSNSSLADDDPNDPEWTISAHEKSAPKLGLVLKLTKR